MANVGQILQFNRLRS